MSQLPEHIKAAIRCGPVPEFREWRGRDICDCTRAERIMRFAERYLVVPEGALVGKSLQIADFQEAFIRAVYDSPTPVTDAYLSVGRKNSKTATIAILVLAHLVGPEAVQNSEILSGARSREQAAQVFRYASKMVRLSPDLEAVIRIVPSSKKLLGLPMGTEYQAGSAEASTTVGGSPVVAVLDELGQIKGPQDDYVDAVTTSQGAHEAPLLIGISTQAPTDADLWSVWLDDAEESQALNIVSHLYETPKDAGFLDEAAWKLSNPALGLFRSIDDMRRQAEKASRMPGFAPTFQNYYLNQRVTTFSPFIAEQVWKDNAAEVAPFAGRKAWAGLDLSSRTDLTAFALVYESGGRWNVVCRCYAPREGLAERAKQDRVPYAVWAKQGWLTLTPGATVDYEHVAKDIAELIEQVDLQGLAFDRWRVDLMRKELDELGVTEETLPLVPFGQGYKDMSPALDTLEADLLNGRVAHGSNPILTMAAATAVVVSDPAGNRKLDKAKSNSRIDPMVALAMARGIAETVEADAPSVYEERGVISL